MIRRDQLLITLKEKLESELYEEVVRHFKSQDERWKEIYDDRRKAYDKIERIKRIIGHYFIEHELREESLAPENYR